MRFFQLISVLLHPIVIPTVGTMLYFLITPISFEKSQKISILSLIFIVTYVIPLLLLILFKKLKQIDSFKTESIKERKIPIALMMIIFYLMGNSMHQISNLKDLALLFFSTSFGLAVIYCCFYLKIKLSLHMLSFGIAIGFFMVLSIIYQQSYTTILIVNIALAGLVAAARLHLKAHTETEIYLGFFIGILAPLLTNVFL